MLFGVGQTRNCITVPIISDTKADDGEIFFATLVRTPDLDGDITLVPVNTEVEIREGEWSCIMVPICYIQ